MDTTRNFDSAWFDGDTYNEVRDAARLRKQIGIVWELVRDGKWRTLEQIAEATSTPEASVSARLRDLRKKRFGSHVVEREFVKRGLWRYRVLPKE